MRSFLPDRFGPARTAAADGMSDVERLLAYEEIRQLAARYALAVDRRDADTLVGLFVADVRTPGGETGQEALRKAFEVHLRADRVSGAPTPRCWMSPTRNTRPSNHTSC